MADIINRTANAKGTYKYQQSVNTPDFPTITWLINPDLSGVSGVPGKYWKVVGETVVEMTQPEKDFVDSFNFTNDQFWEISGASAQSTASEAWANAMSRTSVPLVRGTYRLSYNFELRVVPAGGLNSAGVGRFRVDGSRKADAYHNSVEWTAFAGWDRRVFSDGDQVLLEIDWRREPNLDGNDAIEIRKLKLGVEFIK